MAEEIVGVRKIKVTPDLPIEARKEMSDWERSSVNHKAFVRILEQFPNAECKNCGDSGLIYVSFTRAGPFRETPGHHIGEKLTWFGGDGIVGKGWYIVSKTSSYQCHHCNTNVIGGSNAQHTSGI
jgi:hypothetical protein